MTAKCNKTSYLITLHFKMNWKVLLVVEHLLHGTPHDVFIVGWCKGMLIFYLTAYSKKCIAFGGTLMRVMSLKYLYFFRTLYRITCIEQCEMAFGVAV